MRLSVVIAAIPLAAGGISVADNVQAAVKERTNIPAQELAPALHTLAKIRDFQLVYVSEDVSDLRTSGAVGEFTSEEALRKLLRGTGLSFQYLDAKTVTIVQANRPATEESGKGGSSIVRLAESSASAGDSDDRTDDRGGDEGQDLPGAREGSQVGDRERTGRSNVEEIVITGSRIRGAQNASPVFTITREEIDRAGFATVEELIDQLPQHFGAGASLDTRLDSVTNRFNDVGGRVDDRAGGTSVNLRGLGASSTLVLLNGRRMSPSGFTARFTNISSIPMTAIERVEVLTDGASAIYGSDAIGGVVNFVLRDDYSGAESRLRYGSDSRGDTSNILLGQSMGTSWNNGNLLLAYEYYGSDNLVSRDRDTTSSNDLSRFGGTDWRQPGGNPANIVAGGQTFAIPVGQDGTALTPAAFDPSVPLNLFNGRSFLDVLPEQERHSAFLHMTQKVGKAELFSEAQFSRSAYLARGVLALADITVTDANPFFVDPTGTGLTTVVVENYSFARDLGHSERKLETDSHGAALGIRFDIADNWNGELAGNWSTERGTNAQDRRLNLEALDAAMLQTAPNSAFNPFGDGSNTNPAVLESLVNTTRRVDDESKNELWAINLNVTGKAYDISGGALEVATGVEFRKESLAAFSPADGTNFDTSRDIMAAYAEVFFPLVGESNRRRGLERLELSLAARYEEYSDFGGSVNPKVGFVWSPTKALMLRGTYGTSFKAPALADLDVTAPSTNSAVYFPQFLVDLGIIPFPVIVRQGGSEDLKAEDATTWTAGIEWTPERFEGLSLDLTYFNIDFKDRIDTPGATVVTGSTDPRFSTLLNVSPTPEQIGALVNDPRWLNLFAVPEADILSGAAVVGGILDLRKTNLSQAVVTGMEMQLSYDLETALGSFDVGLNGSYLFDFKRRLFPADPLVDEVDQIGRPVDFRARGNVTWSRKAWTITGFINFMDGYTDNVNDPGRPVDSWTTVDLTLSYSTEGTGVNGLLSDTRFSLTTQNLFDAEPPFVNTFGGLAYDSTNASPLGRMLAMQITKDW